TRFLTTGSASDCASCASMSRCCRSTVATRRAKPWTWSATWTPMRRPPSRSRPGLTWRYPCTTTCSRPIRATRRGWWPPSTDSELDEMAGIAARARVEVSLFARPNAGWDTSAMARAPAGAAVAASARGQDQVVACLDDALRAAAHGFRSVLIADLGVLAAFDALRRAGTLPAD